MLRLTFLMTSVLLVATTFAGEERLTPLDKDKDGNISIQEATVHPDLLASFGSIDVDGNGQISRSELMNSEFKNKLPTLTPQKKHS
ncbi:hypothetical protein EYS14_10470 [Alteromonadaceae bacterium M269]|nr:hypothetical protein EYS14_10470 [Alteromonadaceae bacterium M269]